MCVCDPERMAGWPYVPWIGEYFGACVYTPLDMVAFGLGLGNIGFWLFAQIPQLVENYRNKKVEALHPLFLAQWLVGDATNLLGCIFTHQSPIQLYTAIYFCAMDVLLLAQWGYYTWTGSSRRYQRIEIDEGAYRGDYTFRKKALYGLFFSLAIVLTAQKSWTGFRSVAGDVQTGRVLMAGVDPCVKVVTLRPWEHILGIISAWTSGVLYFTARMPQIYLNFKRKSVEGLAFAMFFCAVSGNTCYGLSIILQGKIFSLALSFAWTDQC